MLYRLCYFSLPFGESSLAIQNCSYNFPTEPNYPEELRAIISKSFVTPESEMLTLDFFSCQNSVRMIYIMTFHFWRKSKQWTSKKLSN